MIEALRKNLSLKCNVKRSGEWLNMESNNLVPGDLVKLTLAGLIPADCVGREIDPSGHVPDDWRVSAGYHDKGRQGCKPNNVWSGLKHTLRFVMLSVRSLFRSTKWSRVARTY